MLAPKLQELTKKGWLGMANNTDCIKQTKKFRRGDFSCIKKFK